MYINKIEELVDKIFDDYYSHITTSKILNIDKIKKEQNFVKYQKEMNDFMDGYTKSINIDEIREIVKIEDNVNSIVELIKRYCAFYLFLHIGFFYVDKDEIYINNVVEYTKNQVEFSYKINDFFNSDNNAILINYYKLIKGINIILDSDIKKITNDIGKYRKDLEKSLEFINLLGEEFVKDNFKLSNKLEKSHNIIKTLIVIK